MAKGYIYCISNPSFKENLYKIGFTTQNLQKRIDSLYKTGVPTKFIINFAKMVKNCRQTEHEIHVKLKRARVNPSREFFKCPLPKIKGIFESYDGGWWGQVANIVKERVEERNFNLRSAVHYAKKKKNKFTNPPKRIKLCRKVKHSK